MTTNLPPILLIEDDDIDVMMVQRCFKELNIPNELLVATNGITAFELLLNLGEMPLPCLVLLDINMPKMNGLEFLAKFKTYERFNPIPIVMLTSSEEKTDIEECDKLGVTGYIVKPIDYAQLVNAIKALLPTIRL